MHLDQASAAKAVKDADALVKEMQRKLRGLGVDWSKVAGQASSVTSEIHAISDAAGVFANKLGGAATSSLQSFKHLADEIENAQSSIEELNEQYKNAGSKEAKEHIEKAIADQVKEMEGLTKQIHSEKSARAKELVQLNKLIKLQNKYQKTVQNAVDFDINDALGSAFDKIKGGDLKGMFKDLGGGLLKNAGSKYAQGAMNKAEAAGGMGTQAGAAEIASASKMLSFSAMAVGASVAVFVGFVALVKAASDHMTKLNSALIQGMGFTNDMVNDTKGYRNVMNEVRKAAIDSHSAMLRFGKNSEDVLKVINAYAKDSTGSLIKTRNAMQDLGKGNLQFGVEEFARNAVVFGKALNMEAEEVASMMGKFQSEMGYGFSQVQGLMKDVVKAAATSSMPMSKFMEIFKSVIPDVELYRNRLEELTGTIKLLSKTMSPKDVKQFMDAFAKGFSGTDFKQRLKTALIVGVPKVSEIAAKDFSSKAGVMAAKFSKYLKGGPSQFMDAFNKGEKGMADLVSEMQAEASKRGEALSGTDIGEAMKLASYEASRQKGDPLAIASAMKGMGMLGTYKVLKEMSQKFTKGFDGLSEHVIAQTGISEQQYEALRKTDQSMKVWKSTLDKFGMTNSKSMNNALREQISIRKFGDITHKDAVNLREATEEDIFLATQQHDESMKTEITAADLAQEQVSATKSISDKLSDVIAYLLEQIFDILQPILDWLDRAFTWLIGGGKAKVKDMQDATDDLVKGFTGEDAGAKKEQAKAISAALVDGLNKGKSGKDLAEFFATSGAVSQEDMKDIDPKKIYEFSRSKGMSVDKAAEIQEAFYQAMKQGNMIEAMKTINSIDGDTGQNLLQLFAGGALVEPNNRFKEAAEKRSAKQRPNTKITAGPTTMQGRAEADRLAKEASDLETMITPEQKADVESYTGKFWDELTDSERDKALEELGVLGPGQSTSQVASSPQTQSQGQSQTNSQTGTASSPGANIQTGAAPIATGQFQSSPVKQVPKDRDTSSDLLGKVKDAVESINVQVMGINTMTDDVIKILKSTGVVLNKDKFKTNVAEASMKDVLDKSISSALMDYFLYSHTAEQIKATVGVAQANDVKSMGDVAGFWREHFEDTYFSSGTKDFGGKIETTGYYRLMRGEEVVNPGLNGGASGGKSVTIHANISVSGAGDPHAVAIAVREELYRQSQRH